MPDCAVVSMDVAVTEFRAHLSDWLEQARGGNEVVITERGIPVARLIGLEAAGTLERLAAEGVIGSLYRDLVTDRFGVHVRLEQARIDWAWVMARLTDEGLDRAIFRPGAGRVSPRRANMWTSEHAGLPP